MPKSENELRREIADAELEYQAEKRRQPYTDTFPHVGVNDEDYEHISHQATRRIELEEVRDENNSDRNRTA